VSDRGSRGTFSTDTVIAFYCRHCGAPFSQVGIRALFQAFDRQDGTIPAADARVFR
jgi:hypothetical protein